MAVGVYLVFLYSPDGEDRVVGQVSYYIMLLSD